MQFDDLLKYTSLDDVQDMAPMQENINQKSNPSCWQFLI